MWIVSISNNVVGCKVVQEARQEVVGKGLLSDFTHQIRSNCQCSVYSPGYSHYLMPVLESIAKIKTTTIHRWKALRTNGT